MGDVVGLVISEREVGDVPMVSVGLFCFYFIRNEEA